MNRQHDASTFSPPDGALAGQCRDPLPPRAREAIRLFNAGQYYKQHDLLELQWREERGPVRDLYRAVLQVGIAYYQITRNNKQGAIKMLMRAARWLAILPDVCQGVDVARLREDALQVRRTLEQMDTDDLSGFDRRLLRPVRLIE
jgi:predicted metal-dependent hydrolase